MKQLIEYTLENGGSIIVEVDEPEGLVRADRGSDVIEKATQKFEEALQKVKPATMAIISTLRELGDSPDEASVEFGVKLSAKAGVIVASADAEANFVFKLTWKRKE
jgi:hypothetical protein